MSRRAALQLGGLAALSVVSSAAAQATPGAGSTGSDATPASSPSGNPVVQSLPPVFQYQDFQFVFLITLGSAYEQASDIGECFATAARIKDFDCDSWVNEWKSLADRMQGIAAQAGDRPSR